MFDYLVIILPPSGDSERTVPLVGLAHLVFQLGTPDIGFLLAPVPQFRVVDANSRNFQRILYHNTFFHAWTAANLLPTGAGGPVRAEEFLYTTPHQNRCQSQSEIHGDDRIHPHNHSNHKLLHDADHDEESPPQSCDGEETYSETKR